VAKSVKTALLSSYENNAVLTDFATYLATRTV